MKTQQTEREALIARLLTQDELKRNFFYNPDTGSFIRLIGTSKSKVGSIAGSKNSEGYIGISILGTPYTAHRLAWLYVYGSWPTNQIDHINRKRDDNRFVNLREATIKQNNENSGIRTNNKSGVKGVSWDKIKGKWKAAISHNRKMLTIGYFESLHIASAAYKAMAAAIHSHNEAARS